MVRRVLSCESSISEAPRNVRAIVWGDDVLKLLGQRLLAKLLA